MRRSVWLAGALSVAVAAGAAGQLVELTRCHAAVPCSVPFGLRPSSTVGNSTFANVGPGNTAIGFHTAVEDPLKPKLIRAPASDDPADMAARLYVRKNPLKPSPVSTPTPAPKPGAP